MDNKTRISKLREDKYQITFGIRKPTFDKMLELLECEFEKLHHAGGRPPRLSVLDKLVVMLGYYHDYRTMENIAFDYNVSKSRISDAVKWVEKTLIEDGTFSLPSKRELAKSDTKIVVAIVDVTECETERPQKNSVNPTPERKNATQ
jgi:hypothetical protein